MDISQSNCKGKREKIWYGDPEGCDLDEMVTDFRHRYLDDTERWLSTLSTYTDFICGEPNIREAPAVKKYCKNLHQYRMPNKTVEKAHEKLKKARLDRYDSFAEIHAIIHELAKEIDYYGVLATYDFSQRCCYSRGILPDGVYLHAGVVRGARELKKMGYDLKIVDLGERGSVIELSSLPLLIAELGTLHAENFLCIYKDLLAKLATSK